MGKSTKIRPGFYEYRNFFIEKKDEAAEVYPGDLGFNQWAVTELWTNETWLATFATLAAAKSAIDEHLVGAA